GGRRVDPRQRAVGAGVRRPVGAAPPAGPVLRRRPHAQAARARPAARPHRDRPAPTGGLMTTFPTPRGLWLTVLGPDALEALPLDGIGWLGVDLQHGSLEARDLPGILRVCRVPVLARAASQDAAHLARVLDTGVDGVIVPGVGSGEEAAALVAAVRL